MNNTRKIRLMNEKRDENKKIHEYVTVGSWKQQLELKEFNREMNRQAGKGSKARRRMNLLEIKEQG